MIRQREIYLANLNPTKGHEQKGQRPVVIVSGDTMNQHLGIVIICPVSSQVKNYAGCLQLKKNRLNKLSKDSEIITFQIRAIAAEKLVKKIGEISPQELAATFQKLNDVLTY